MSALDELKKVQQDELNKQREAQRKWEIEQLEKFRNSLSGSEKSDLAELDKLGDVLFKFFEEKAKTAPCNSKVMGYAGYIGNWPKDYNYATDNIKAEVDLYLNNETDEVISVDRIELQTNNWQISISKEKGYSYGSSVDFDNALKYMIYITKADQTKKASIMPDAGRDKFLFGTLLDINETAGREQCVSLLKNWYKELTTQPGDFIGPSNVFSIQTSRAPVKPRKFETPEHKKERERRQAKECEEYYKKYPKHDDVYV